MYGDLVCGEKKGTPPPPPPHNTVRTNILQYIIGSVQKVRKTKQKKYENSTKIIVPNSTEKVRDILYIPLILPRRSSFRTF